MHSNLNKNILSEEYFPLEITFENLMITKGVWNRVSSGPKKCLSLFQGLYILRIYLYKIN